MVEKQYNFNQVFTDRREKIWDVRLVVSARCDSRHAVMDVRSEAKFANRSSCRSLCLHGDNVPNGRKCALVRMPVSLQTRKCFGYIEETAQAKFCHYAPSTEAVPRITPVPWSNDP